MSNKSKVNAIKDDNYFRGHNFPERLDESIGKITDCLTELRTKNGINMKAILVLLQDQTKLPKRTLIKVLDGLDALYSEYCEKPSAAS